MPDENLTPDELRERGFTEEEIAQVAQVKEAGVAWPGSAPAPLDPLLAFVRARLDEREARALAAQGTTEGRWEQDDPVRAPGRIVDDYGDTVTYDEGAPSEAQAVHIVDNDPQFVLADVAAKRQIVDLFVPCPDCLAGRRCIPHDSSAGPPGFWRFLDEDHERIARLLALPFAGHADYREEWKP